MVKHTRGDVYRILVYVFIIYYHRYIYIYLYGTMCLFLSYTSSVERKNGLTSNIL